MLSKRLFFFLMHYFLKYSLKISEQFASKTVSIKKNCLRAKNFFMVVFTIADVLF